MVEKIGPYRVYERLGVGGMGEVYKAYDDRLERWVAIKRIRPDREDAEDNRERFKREARATARLNHPSIVHLYGIFQDGDSDCIVMEYVEGETLDRKLMSGPLDPLQVATLGHEIASGLAEAHANGILHRDLKAENIIITPKGRSKILDFGLAKPILSGELDPVLTGKGQLVGTSRAMSPEYVGGESIDHRSDLFSLGVLLYECLTGQSPFKAHNTLATLKQVMLHKQTPIRELNADVPVELSEAVDQLLEKEPDDRPQSAQDVSLNFGTLCGQMSSGIIDRPSGPALLESTASRLRSATKTFSSSETMLDLRPRRRWMTGLAVIAGLLVVAFLLGRFFDQEPEVAPLPEGELIRVVLGDFVNQTDESVFDDSLQQAMRVDLEQSRFVAALPQSQVRETLTRMQKATSSEVDRQTAVEIARREGAHRVVLGQIQQFGSAYSLLVQVVAPENDVTTFSAAEAAKNHEGILAAIQKLTTAVRRHLGESSDQINQSTTPLERVTTANFEALRAYTLGEERMSLQKFDEAVPLFRRAVELDPSFGMAHAKLVAAFSNLGNTDLAAKAALDAQKNAARLTEEERFYVDGWVARWLGTPQDVINVWSLFRDLHPENFVGHSNLALAYWYYRNDFESAAAVFESAVRTAQAPREKELLQGTLGLCRFALGRFDSAVEPLAEGGVRGAEGLAYLKSAQGDFEAAFAEVDKLNVPSTLWVAQHVVDTSRGSLRSALDTVVSARESWSADGSQPRLETEMNAAVSQLSIAAVLDEKGRLDEAIQLVEGLAADADPFSRTLDEASAPMTAQAIKVLVRANRLERATSLRRMLPPPPHYTPGFVQALIDVADAELAMAAGHLDEAESYLKRAEGLVTSLSGRDSLGRLQELRGDTKAAIAAYRWVQAHSGLAYMECYLSCPSISSAVITWTLSSYRLGRLLEAEGELPEARAAYSLFVERWGDTETPEVLAARERLASLPV